VILYSTEEDALEMEICGVLHYGGSNLRNSASYVLDQYRTLIGNNIHCIEWYICEKHIRNPLNAALSTVSNSLHVALSQHLMSYLFETVLTSKCTSVHAKEITLA